MRRTFLIAFSVIIILSLLCAAVGFSVSRRSFPQINGSIQLPGLDGPVDIYRDPQGVAHIYASTTHDLFLAQGYVHAQERFWQMDFWRHIGSGRLSEMFGKSQVETDTFLREMGWARVASRELEQLDPDSRQILDSYAQGVNAYISRKQGVDLSLEYAVLKLTNPAYTIEPWKPLHSLTWAKAMAWDLRGNMDEEGDRTTLLRTLSPEQVNQLYPPYPQDHPFIVTNLAQGLLAPSVQERARNDQTDQAQLANLTADQSAQVKARSTALDLLLGPSGVGVGSNNWVISGKLTTSGKPLLANDPHLGSQMPSIWYEVGLHCRPKNEKCPFDVTGFSFAGAPGVIIGHNERIAWGFTNVGPDVQDVYIERINPYKPDQFEVNGKWVDMQVVNETILVAGGDPVDIRVRYTRHGPILWDDQKNMDEFAVKAGVDLPFSYRLALRWTALEESNTFPAIWQMDKAQNWQDFRAAAAKFDVPAQNFVYADVDGNIGYQMPGKIPIRPAGVDGRQYVPGWTDAYEWQGYVPFDQLPSAFNPHEGYIATANNAVVSSDYPYLITTDWDYGFRAQRIKDMLRSAPGKIDAAYIQKMQGDNLTPGIDFLLPVLMQTDLKDASLSKTREIFNNWDGQCRMDSPQAALFSAFFKNLLARTFNDDLPEDQWPEGGDRWFAVLRNLVGNANSAWWDDKNTKQVEDRAEIFRQSFALAVAEMQKLQGSDPARWRWGDLHTITFRNQTLGKSGIAPIEALFNRGPFPTAGGKSIVNATGWTTTNTPNPYEVDWLPSMRMIVDLSDLNKSLAVHTTGQSGHAYHPHYTDMIDLWRNIQYLPMTWDDAQIKNSAEGHLILKP